MSETSRPPILLASNATGGTLRLGSHAHGGAATLRYYLEVTRSPGSKKTSFDLGPQAEVRIYYPHPPVKRGRQPAEWLLGTQAVKQTPHVTITGQADGTLKIRVAMPGARKSSHVEEFIVPRTMFWEALETEVTEAKLQDKTVNGL